MAATSPTLYAWRHGQICASGVVRLGGCVYWLSLWCILALVLGCVPGSAVAQVTMEARLGLQGVLRLGKWNALTVQVHNAGGAVIGTLGVRTWLGSEARGDFHTTTFTRPVELPPGARKRFTFAVPISGIADPVEVTLRTDETVLAQQRLDLHEALHAEQVIVGLTQDVSLDFLATVFTKTHTRVVYLPPNALPQHWSGYDSVSAVVVKGVSLQALSAEQNTALHEWLANGGTLIAAGDSQYTLLTEPRLRTLLPVEVLGLQQVAGLPEFAAHYDVPFPETPMVVVRARLTRGQVLVGTPDVPLLVQRRFGKGRVVFLAVDYAMQPFPSWQGRGALWNDILQTPENIVFALYALSPLLERGLNQPALIFDVTTMELLSETGYAHLHGHLGVFSVRGGQFDLAFQQPETILRHTFTRGVGKAGKDLEASIAGGFTLHNIALEPWALRVFSTESMAPTPVQVSVQPHAAGLTIQVQNRSTLPLQGATVVYQGKIFALGAVTPGEAVLDDLYPTLRNAESAQEMTWRVLLKRRPAEADTRLAYLQEVLLQQYFGDKRLAEASETPFLVGWLLAPSTLVPAPAAWPAQGVTLVVSRLTL